MGTAFLPYSFAAVIAFAVGDFGFVPFLRIVFTIDLSPFVFPVDSRDTFLNADAQSLGQSNGVDPSILRFNFPNSIVLHRTVNATIRTQTLYSEYT
jgi:hypothetical protein